MSQAVGYSIAATSPFLFGALLGASRHRLVGQPEMGAGGDFSLATRRA